MDPAGNYFFGSFGFVGKFYDYTHGSDEHGPRFLTGGPGAAPGGVASKNGCGHMRVRGESISYACFIRVCMCLNAQDGGWPFQEDCQRLPRRVAE